MEQAPEDMIRGGSSSEDSPRLQKLPPAVVAELQRAIMDRDHLNSLAAAAQEKIRALMVVVGLDPTGNYQIGNDGSVLLNEEQAAAPPAVMKNRAARRAR